MVPLSHTAAAAACVATLVALIQSATCSGVSTSFLLPRGDANLTNCGMAEFVWEARSPTGELRKGSMEAETEDGVESKLRAMKLVPTRVRKKALNINLSALQIGSGVSQKDLVTFTRLFATMIDAGLPIVQCLDILANQTDNKLFGGILRDIKG